jgi:hypothetical protein
MRPPEQHEYPKLSYGRRRLLKGAAVLGAVAVAGPVLWRQPGTVAAAAVGQGPAARYRADGTGSAEATDDGTDRQLAEPSGDVPGQGAEAEAARPLVFVPWRPARTELPRSPEAWSFNIRQLTDVLRCKLQHHFCCKHHRAVQYLCPSLPGDSAGGYAVPGSADSDLPGNPMNLMAPTLVQPGGTCAASGCPPTFLPRP